MLSAARQATSGLVPGALPSALAPSLQLMRSLGAPVIAAASAVAGCSSYTTTASVSSSSGLPSTHVFDENDAIVGPQVRLGGGGSNCDAQCLSGSGKGRRAARPATPLLYSTLHRLQTPVTKRLWATRYKWTADSLAAAAPRDPAAAIEPKPPKPLNITYPFSSDAVLREHVRGSFAAGMQGQGLV